MQITSNHFGGHILAPKDPIDTGGPFLRFNDLIDFTSYRYPGGSITEDIALEGRFDDLFGDPMPYGSRDRLVTVREVQEFAATQDATIQFVIPTRALLTEGAPGNRGVDQGAVDAMIGRLGEILDGAHGPMRVEHFQIGNEWWGAGERYYMTASEYGMVADAVIEGLAPLIRAKEEASWDQVPKIVLQAGVGWREDGNQDILAEISLENRGEIGSISTHFYPPAADNIPLRMRLFEMAREMAEAEGMQSPDFIVTEWNVHAASDGDRGMAQASTILEAFDFMVANGVTDANIWGTNYKFLETRLAQMSHNPWDGRDPEDISLTLTPAGHVYRIMAAELPGSEIGGTELEDILVTAEDPDTLRINSYSSEDRTTVFLSSRSGVEQQIIIDLDGLDAEHVWVRILGAVDDPRTPNRDEGDPLSPDARAELRSFSGDNLPGDGSFTLPPHGILVLTATHDAGIGVRMEGDVQIIDPDGDHGDLLVGSRGNDLLRGHHGDDRLVGGDGNDILDGGDGDDTLEGGSGHNLLIGGAGDDLILSTGSDVILPGAGATRVFTDEDPTIILTEGGQVDVDLGGPSLLVLAPDAKMSVSGFSPAESHLFLPDVHFQTEDLTAFMATVGDALMLSHPTGEGMIFLEGMAGREAEVAGSFFQLKPEEEQAAIVRSVTDGMTRMQRLEMEKVMDDLPGGSDILDLAGPLPAAESGYGQRLAAGAGPGTPEESDPPGQGGQDDDHDDPDDGGFWLPPEEPREEDRGAEEDRDEADGASGGCMIADGLFGGIADPRVERLRKWRDLVLAPHPAGRRLIRAYYTVSPHLTPWLTHDGISGAIGRALLAIPEAHARRRIAF